MKYLHIQAAKTKLYSVYFTINPHIVNVKYISIWGRTNSRKVIRGSEDETLTNKPMTS